ncbi:MAG: hypothetical protein R3F11_33115 [Verrucomicrobiales bacterium]
METKYHAVGRGAKLSAAALATAALGLSGPAAYAQCSSCSSGDIRVNSINVELKGVDPSTVATIKVAGATRQIKAGKNTIKMRGPNEGKLRQTEPNDVEITNEDDTGSLAESVYCAVLEMCPPMESGGQKTNAYCAENGAGQFTSPAPQESSQPGDGDSKMGGGNRSDDGQTNNGPSIFNRISMGYNEDGVSQAGSLFLKDGESDPTDPANFEGVADTFIYTSGSVNRALSTTTAHSNRIMADFVTIAGECEHRRPKFRLTKWRDGALAGRGHAPWRSVGRGGCVTSG